MDIYHMPTMNVPRMPAKLAPSSVKPNLCGAQQEIVTRSSLYAPIHH